MSELPLEAQAAPAPPAPPKAGRDLKAAIAVGLALAALVVGTVLMDKRAFMVVLVVAIAVGAWELRQALAQRGLVAPLVPLLVGAVAMPVSAFVDGPEALVLTYGWVITGMTLWRMADGLDGAVRDVSAGALIALYPCLLGGFASMLLAAPDGERRLLVFILVTVFSDIGGTPMAPTISPKKSWEGFAGSVLVSAVVGAISLPALLDGPWWAGALLGAMAASTATVGDLIESSIKRDLGIKDMSELLPGHGGLMDRLDSLIVTVAPVWAVLLWIVPPASAS